MVKYQFGHDNLKKDFLTTHHNTTTHFFPQKNEQNGPKMAESQGFLSFLKILSLFFSGFGVE